jgi:hypothetical protein
VTTDVTVAAMSVDRLDAVIEKSVAAAESSAETAEKLAQNASDAATDAPASGPPSRNGVLAAGGLLVVAIVVSFSGWGEKTAFTPESDFKLFAGFYVVAQALERLLEVGSRVIVPGDGATDKGNRALVLGGFSVVLGVCASKLLGLYFLAAVGVNDPHRGIDVLATGLLLGGGTKALHDLIGRIEKSKENAAATVVGNAAEGAATAGARAAEVAATASVAVSGTRRPDR